MKHLFSTLPLLLTEAASSPAAQQVFVWSEHVGEIITVALLSMVPTFEGRYALLVGQAMGMPLLPAFLLAFVMSTVPIPFVFWLLKPILKWFYSLSAKPVQRFTAWIEGRAQKKAKDLETGSLVALFMFVAIPLTGTGVWTGSIIATLLDMDRKRAGVAIALGNLGACAIMTAVYFGIDAVLRAFGLA